MTDPGATLPGIAELAAEPVPDIRLIVADMDGTLLDGNHELHDELWPLLAELDRRDILFCPASGRHHVSLRSYFAETAPDVTYIAANGAHVLRGDTELHSDCVAPVLAREVLTVMRDVDDAQAVLVGRRTAFIQRSDQQTFRWIHDYVPPLTVVDDIVDSVDVLLARGDAILNVGIFDNRSAEQNSLVALAGLRDRLCVMATQPTWVDVVSPTASKGHAVAALQRDRGIGPDQTLVFGDFLNDLTMFEHATYGVAMENAHPLVKQRASWVAPPNTANGVVRSIRALLDMPNPLG
jgi:Cof subfamily protein (haloacid dehalogenase superfamily)